MTATGKQFRQTATIKMKTQESFKALKIAAILLFAAMLLPWSITGAGHGGQQQEPLNVVGFQSTLREKLGSDDGVSFIIHFGGDTHGNLDACG